MLTGTDRERWLAWRREGIGASDVAAIVGLSPWSSPVSVWLEKTGQLEVEVTEAMAWGSRLEDAILDEWERRTGEAAIFRQATLERIADDERHHRATIDAMSHDSQQILEVKNVGSWPWRDEIPLHYQIQIQWQLWVAERELGQLVALHTGNQLQTYPVERDQKAIDQLIERVDHFWHTYVQPGQMPPADDSDATHQALRDAFGETTDRAVKLADDHLAAIQRRQQLKDQISELEAEVKECESTIFAALGDAERGEYQGEKLVSWKTITVEPSVRDGYSYRRLSISKKQLERLEQADE